MTARFKVLVCVALVAALLTTAVGCGGGGATPQPTVKSAGGASPVIRRATSTPARSTTSADVSSRIGDSVGKLLMDDEVVFKSFHIESSGSDPSWDATAAKVQTEDFTLKADVAGDDLYLVYSSSKGGAAAKVTEGYAIDGGMSGDDGKEYVVDAGKLKESIGAVSMTWAFFPLTVVLPLSVASIGATAQGTEAIDGRQADKYEVDTAKAPAGSMGALSAMFTITKAQGTVWVDKETGALLKCDLNYEQNLLDKADNKTVVGSGKGTLQLLVTKVNNVTVTLPK